jgi:hypothetical protein
MKNPITPEGAASAQNPLPPVPTTKILAISHFMGTPMTRAQRAQITPHEVHDTVNACLGGKIDQWYFRTDGEGCGFHRQRKHTGRGEKHFGEIPAGAGRFDGL